MTIKLAKETEQRAIASIKRYFEETLDQEIGELKASMFLSFCLCEFGPTIYNKAIADAQAQLQDRVADLDGSCYEPEFSYWKR